MIPTVQAKTSTLIFLLIIIAVASTGAAYYFYRNNQQAQKLLHDPDAVAREEIKSIVDKVGIFIELPANEEPTLATVSDKEKLKDQPFFTKAENGDKVLIYTQEKKAILYRPSTNKIIEVAPINLGAPEAAAEVTPTPATTPVRVALYNGTSVSGLTKKVEETLKQQLPTATVVAKENAKSNTYTSTIVSDINGSKTNEAQQIAALIGGTVGQLPEGEKKAADTDIVVIIGQSNTPTPTPSP